jgi:hypothetical protein
MIGWNLTTLNSTGERLDREARADLELDSAPREKTTRGFIYLFVYYWWVPIAIISIGGMFFSIISPTRFSNQLNLLFLMLSILAAAGWYTRDKTHSQPEVDVQEEPGIKVESSSKID